MLLLVVGVGVGAKFYFNSKFSPNELKKITTNFFNSNFNRAVKFENSFINYLGEIVISNFNLSVTNDFNDNISLIKARQVVAQLDYSSLFQGVIKIKSINFIDSEVSVFKKYFQYYLKNLTQLKEFRKKINQIESLEGDNFLIKLTNSKLFYSEIYKDRKIKIESQQLLAKISFVQDKIFYSFAGEINSLEGKKRKGSINLSGQFFLDESETYSAKIDLKNFDLLYLNDFLRKYELGYLSLSGGFKTNLALKAKKDIIKIAGKIKTNNLTLTSYQKTPTAFILNENLDLETEFEFSDNFNYYNFKKLKFTDSIFDLFGVGQYLKTDEKHFIEVKFNSNQIDLKEMSEFFTPFIGFKYDGELIASGKIKYDFKNNRAEDLLVNLGLKNFILKKISGTKWLNVIEKGNLSINLNKDKLNLSSTFRNFNSDFRFNNITKISSWSPFKSQTSLDIKSKILSSQILFKGVTSGIRFFYDLGYEDKKKGYNNIFFLKKPLGQLVNNNNFSVNYKADQIFLGGKAKLNNFLFELSLDEGLFRLKNFHLQGYDGSYSLEIDGKLDKNYPTIDFFAFIYDLDLADLSKDYGAKEDYQGKFNLELDGQLMAYRMSHLIQNSRINFDINIKNGFAPNSNLQDRLNLFFRKNNYNLVNFNDFSFRDFSFKIAQTGENFRIKRFSLDSDIVSFYAYGKFCYFDGVDLKIYSLIKDINGKRKGVPLEVKDGLFSPELCLIKKNNPCLLLFSY